MNKEAVDFAVAGFSTPAGAGDNILADTKERREITMIRRMYGDREKR